MRESEKREDGLLTDPFERIKPLRDTGFGVARADGTAVDFAFAWQGGSGLWYTVESAYDALDEEAGDIYVEPDLLDAVLGIPAGSDSVHVWYRSAFPEDGLGEKIDPDLTFREAEEAVALGGGFYDALGVGDSVVRERVFTEIARRDGIDYGDVYEAWSEVGYLTQLDYRTTVKPDDLYTVLHGDIVAVGHDPLVGDFISLTDAQVQKVTDYFTDKSAPGSGELEEAAILAAEHEKKVDIVAADLSAALEGSAADFEAMIDALLDSCLGRDDSDDGER